MSKKVLIVLLISVTLYFVYFLCLIFGVPIGSLSDIMIYGIPVVVGLVFFTIFSFCMEKKHNLLAIIGYTATGLLVGSIIYYIVIMNNATLSVITSTNYKIVTMIMTYDAPILWGLTSLALFFIFESENGLFTLYKIVALVASIVLVVISIVDNIKASHASSISLYSLLYAKSYKFELALYVIYIYAYIGAIITYLMSPKEKKDLTNENYYANVNNLTFNQNNLSSNGTPVVQPEPIPQPVQQPVQQVAQPQVQPVPVPIANTQQLQVVDQQATVPMQTIQVQPQQVVTQPVQQPIANTQQIQVIQQPIQQPVQQVVQPQVQPQPIQQPVQQIVAHPQVQQVVPQVQQQVVAQPQQVVAQPQQVVAQPVQQVVQPVVVENAQTVQVPVVEPTTMLPSIEQAPVAQPVQSATPMPGLADLQAVHINNGKDEQVEQL